MAITISRASLDSNVWQKIRDMKIGVYQVVGDSSYPAGGYSLELGNYFKSNSIDDVLVSQNGGYTAEWDATTNKLIFTKGGAPVVTGTDLSNIKLKLYVFSIPGFLPLSVSPASEIASEAGSTFLRKDTDDVAGPGVTTQWGASGGIKINSGATVSIESGATQTVSGTQTIVGTQDITGASEVKSGGSQTIASGATQTVDGTQTVSGTQNITGTSEVKSGATQTVASGATQTIAGTQNITGNSELQSGAVQTVAAGATISIVGKVNESDVRTFDAGDSDTPSVTQGKRYIVSGAITPSITNFDNGSEGDVVSIYCSVDGCTITHDATKIDLASDVNFTMTAGSNITFRMKGGVWVEEGRWSSVGSRVVGDGGELKTELGSTTTIAGVEKKPASVIGTAVSTPDVANASNLEFGDSTDFDLSSFQNGVTNQVLTIHVAPNATQTITLKHGTGNILLQNGTDTPIKANDTMQFKFNGTNWVQINGYSNVGNTEIGNTGTLTANNGSTIVMDTGSIQTLKGVVRTESVEITSNGQDLSTTSYAKITASTPSTINQIGTPSPANGQKLLISSSAAKTIQDAVNGGGMSNITLPGNVDILLDANDQIELTYDSTSGKWIGRPIFVP